MLVQSTKAIGVLSVISFLAACAFGPRPLTVDECLTLDPYQAGFGAGQAGYPPNFQKIQQDCATHELFFTEQDFVNYDQGWNEGILRFCQAPRAFAFGKQGDAFPGVCSATPNIAELRSEYSRGYGLFTQMQPLRNRIAEIDYQLNAPQRISDEINDLDYKIIDARDKYEDRLDFFGPDSGLTRDASNDLDKLYADRERLEREYSRYEPNSLTIGRISLTGRDPQASLYGERDALAQQLSALEAIN